MKFKVSSLTRPLQLVTRSHYLRNIGVLAGGTLMSQLLLALSSPVLTRLYSPVDFGMFGLFVAYTNIAAKLLMVNYETAIVSASDDRESAHLFYGCVLIALLVSLFSSVIFMVAIQNAWWGFDIFPYWISLFVFMMLFSLAIFTSLKAWQTRQGEFRQISQIAFAQNLVRVISPIGFGWLYPVGSTIIVSEFLGRLVGALLSIKESSLQLSKHRLSFSFLYSVLQRYSSYPIYGLPSAFLDTLGNYIAVPLIATYYGVAMAGKYLLVVRITSIPASLVGASVADVFHKRMADFSKESSDKARALLTQTATMLSIIGGIPVLLVAFLGPVLFEWFFGSQWQVAGEMARILSLSMLAQIVVSPISRVVYIYGQQRKKLIFDIVNLITMGLPFPLGRYLGLDVNQSLLILSIGQVIAYAIYLKLLWDVTKK